MTRSYSSTSLAASRALVALSKNDEVAIEQQARKSDLLLLAQREQILPLVLRIEPADTRGRSPRPTLCSTDSSSASPTSDARG